MQLVFFETQEWEKELLSKEFPNAIFSEEKLTATNAEQYKDAELVSSFIYSSFSKEVLSQLPKLRFICTRSTGIDHIDIQTCKEKNIQIANVPEYGSNTVAEFTFALLLDVSRKVTKSVNQAKQVNFQHDRLRGIDLYGKTLGIIGLGKIGIRVVQIAKGFGMNILVYTRTQDEKLREQYGFSYADLETLLKTSDVLSLHLPLTSQTTHLLNSQNILLCKKGCILINTARGGLVETEAILLGLEKEILSGVGLDVLEGEGDLAEEAILLSKESQNIESLKTLLYNHVLLNHPKVIITPHNAFNSQEALVNIANTTIENIKKFISN